jgi:iron(III) transport system substrate-binding protein
MTDRSTRRRRHWLLTSAIAGSLVLVACGGDDTTDDAGDDTTAAVDQEPASTAAGGDAPAATEPTTATGTDTAPAGGEGLVIDGELIADQALLDAAQDQGALRLYTTGTEEGAVAINEGFTEDTGIDVELFRAPGSELTQRILAEADGGVHNFDVVGLTSPSDMLTLKDEGLLAAYEPATVDEHLIVPEEVDPDRTFYPVYAWLYVIGVNRGVVDESVLVETWDDIVQPEFTGLLGITPAGVGGTGIAQAAFQQEVLGEEYWTKLAAVEPVIFSTTSTVAESLTRGEISVAVAAESVMAPAIASGAPIELVYPEVGVIGGVSYQAVSANAENAAAAQLFQNWSLSKRGQDVIATEGGARPIRDDAHDAEIEGAELPPQADLNIWWSELPSRLETKDELIASWNAAVGYTAEGG